MVSQDLGSHGLVIPGPGKLCPWVIWAMGSLYLWGIFLLGSLYVCPKLSQYCPSVWGLKLKIWSRIQSNLSSSWWYIHIFYCQNHQNVFLDQYRHLRLVGQSVQTTSNYSNFAGILFFTFRAKILQYWYLYGYAILIL